MLGRIPVMDVAPLADRGRYPVKAAVGEPFEISATVFREGHDEWGCDVVLTAPDGTVLAPIRMDHGPDVTKWSATVVLDIEGMWTYSLRSFDDPLGTWLHNTEVKVPAGVDEELMFTEGALLLDRLASECDLTAAQAQLVADTKAGISDQSRPIPARLQIAISDQVRELFQQVPLRDLSSAEGPFEVYVDRHRALFGSWYEFFPRSEGAKLLKNGKVKSGNFSTAAKRLPAIADMGFDVLYLPPIHPIGEINRKGRNNTLDPGPDDVGSPWAIGSKDGGHDAIHPDLGTMKSFTQFVAKANKVGLEVALDFALQAAPDHPWVTSHPEWFTTRADGTIAYAENPPKKYQDIYPINFDNDPEGIYREVLRVLRIWMDAGIRIFRVDNPHTKPVAFWDRLLTEIRRTDPDVLFLAEAFTKPAMMKALGTVGFHQSYTYFTWRTAKQEIADYFTEVSSETAHVMRPNFFVNTPDILHASLQYGGPAMFKIRAALAATASPTWGVYAGYELFEHVAVKPGSEEYLDSEKFQIRIRDFDEAAASGRTLAPYLTMLNRLRREHPALQQLRNLRVHSSDDDAILVYSKQERVGDPTSDTVLVVANLDPHATRETMIHLDLPALGMDWQDTLVAHDEITNQTWQWSAHNYVRLDPGHEPVHLLTVRRAG